MKNKTFSLLGIKETSTEIRIKYERKKVTFFIFIWFKFRY